MKPEDCRRVTSLGSCCGLGYRDDDVHHYPGSSATMNEHPQPESFIVPVSPCVSSPKLCPPPKAPRVCTYISYHRHRMGMVLLHSPDEGCEVHSFAMEGQRVIVEVGLPLIFYEYLQVNGSATYRDQT